MVTCTLSDYINDLVCALEHGSPAIQIEVFIIQCLLYADDIALIAKSKQNLQYMFNILRNSCKNGE